MNAQSADGGTGGARMHVLVVSAPDCHFCSEAKAVLERLGRAYPLAVEEVSLSSPQGQEMAARHGILFPPGVFLEDSFVGFGRLSERKFRRLLDQRTQAAGAHRRA